MENMRVPESVSVKLKIYMLALVGALLFAAAPATYAGNGGGVSGPILDGEAIPVKLDRGVSLLTIKNAIKTCLYLGDANRGLVSVTERLARQIHAPKVSLVNDGVEVELADVPYWAGIDSPKTTGLAPHGLQGVLVEGADLKYVQYGSISLRQSLTEYWINDPRSSGQTVNHRIRAGTLSVGVRYGEEKGPGLYKETTLYSTLPFPLVSWDRIEREPVPDELGTADENDTVVSGVRIEVPKEYGAGEMVGFYNYKNFKEASVQVSAREYVECLQSEIQR